MNKCYIFIVLALVQRPSENALQTTRIFRRSVSEANKAFQCGTISDRPTNLIWSGAKAKLKEWPWHGALFHHGGNGSKDYACGVTLIDQNYALTSAHCVMDEETGYEKNKRAISVDFGSVTLKGPAQFRKSYKILKIFRHPEYYYSNSTKHDIAILSLESSISFNEYIRPICLPRYDLNGDIHDIIGEYGHVVGFGMAKNKKISEDLLHGKLPVVSHAACQASNPDLFANSMYDGMFCAGSRNRTSVCRGDSGSGMYFHIDNKWILRGITSFSGDVELGSLECDTKNYAGFIHVSYYMEWIRNKTNITVNEPTPLPVNEKDKDIARGSTNNDQSGTEFSIRINEPEPVSVKPVIVMLLLVIDQTAYQKLHKSTKSVHEFCSRLVNRMNLSFSMLHLKIALVDVIIWYEKDSVNISSDIAKTMSDFENYNEQLLLVKSNHTHAQLITGKTHINEFNSSQCNKAQLNTICTNKSSSVVMLRANFKLQSTLSAHAIAHSLNINHSGSRCSKCIMAPNIHRTHPADQLSWTVGNIKDFMNIIDHKQCLFNENPKEFDPNSCGNGVVDPGEECDIGQRDKESSKCCEAWSCRLPSNQHAIQQLRETIIRKTLELENKKSTNEQLVYDPNSNKKGCSVTLNVKLILVVDQAAYKRFKNDTDEIRTFCYNLKNYSNSLFEMLFIKITLVDCMIWEEHDEIEISTNSNKTLSNFVNHFKNNASRGKIHHQLITGIAFDGALGRGMHNSICGMQSASVVSLHSINVPKLQAVSNANMLGHALNMTDFDSKCDCPRCIMARQINKNGGQNLWTVDNIRHLALGLQKNNWECLFDKTEVFEPNTCRFKHVKKQNPR